MIVFAIPLRAKETSKNWTSCVKNFNRTLRSVFNQTNPDFRCIVACNEKPELEQEYDERLEFIELDMPIPQEWIEMARDKFWKLTMIAVRVRKLLEESSNPECGIYVMPVDADDLLNCHIAEYCAAHPGENGLVSNDGYVWRGAKKYFEIYPEMHTYCGSCNIIKMYRDDLPEKCPASPALCHDGPTAGELNERYPIRYDHNTVVARYAEKGCPFMVLPFRSTVYVLGTGDNISSVYHTTHTDGTGKCFHPIAFLRSLNIFRKKFISRKLKAEFGMN